MFDFLVFDLFILNNLVSVEMASLLLIIFLLTLLIGLSGILINYNNILFTIISLEIINIASILYVLIFAKLVLDPQGYIFANYLLLLTGTESAMGLGILIVLFHFGQGLVFSSYINIKG